MAPRRTVSHRSKATREAFASKRRGRSADPGRQHSLAHQASARLNMLAAKLTAVSIAEGPARRQSARRPSHIGPFSSPDNRFCRVLNRPWGKKVPGIGRRSGSKPPLLVSRAQRWLGRGRERRWKLRSGRFHRCTGRLNATQPGVLAVSIPYIRGLGSACKGSVAARQHSFVFAIRPLRRD